MLTEEDDAAKEVEGLPPVSCPIERGGSGLVVAVLAVDLSRLLALESPSPPSSEDDMLVGDECSAIVIQFAV